VELGNSIAALMKSLQNAVAEVRAVGKSYGILLEVFVHICPLMQMNNYVCIFRKL
jgi:hypothetical protein